jgi:cation diffusion facilitator CzcD-associated flavoprotein CzcO
MVPTNTNGDLTFKRLNVLVIGGGLGGLAAAITLRRQGHQGKIGTIIAQTDLKFEWNYVCSYNLREKGL